MKKIRSDPYTGTAILYAYLYCGGMNLRHRNLVLRFANSTQAMWQQACSGRGRRDVRLYRLTADGIILADGFIPKSDL